MDTTPKYIKMLKAVPKIQALWDPNIGDYHLWNDSLTVIGPTQFETATGFEIRDKVDWGDKEQYGQYIIGYFKEWVIMDFKTTTPFKCKDIIKQFQEIYKVYTDAIWLPRQDQLQDMLGGYVLSIGILIKYINDPDFDLRYFSWEQAWLCIVMYEKYNKKWDGKEWV